MKKVLLLSSNTGEGHNSAAAAIAVELSKQGIAFETVDPLAFKSERAKKAVAASYNNVIKNVPKVFSAVYKLGEAYSNAKLASPIYYANSLYAEKLNAYITQQEFDCIICTHLFAMEALTAIRKKWGLSVPCYGVLTDYTCVPFFYETILDGYFIPHEDLRGEMVEKGLPADRIYATGIPVDEKFSREMSREEARNYLEIPVDKPVVLLMGGGVGCGNMIELCREVMSQDEESLIYVLVGRNSKLGDKLNDAYGAGGRVFPVPFTKEVNVYMKAADVMISKAGGLSSTEAAVANIPLVQLLVYTACEAKNADFFAKHGMSEKAGNARNAAELSAELLRDKEKAERMRERQRSTINPKAAEMIVKIAGERGSAL